MSRVYLNIYIYMDIYLYYPNGYNKIVSINLENLRLLRLDKKMTQHQLADKIGIELISYGRYERGERIPPSDILSKLADVLGCTTDYLLERVDEPNLVHYELPNVDGMQIAIDIVEDALKDGLTPDDIKKFVALAMEMKNGSNKD